MRVLSVAAGLAAGHMLRASVDEQAGARLWVPIVRGGDTQYFNPVTNAMSDELPTNGRAAPAVSFAQDKEAEEAGVGAEATNNDLGDVVTSTKKACYPHCTWNCTQPVCNQDCTPECEQPRCQTRCPRPDYTDCKIDCETPHCSVFCPKDACEGQEGSDCSSPKCSTKCAQPVCRLACANTVPCLNVCHPPRCSWNCRNPKVCARPQCRLVCEKPLGCAQTYELPPLSPSLTVQRNFAADKARWITYSWSRCATECGESVATRKVTCSTGQDHECQFAPKPATTRVCAEREGCNRWQAGNWTKCSATCGKGMRTREVGCPHEDEKECTGTKPPSEESCWDRGAHCRECSVELFGEATFSGWQATFEPGRYNTEEMIMHGARCEEVSSIKIVGHCCKAKFYQYGDFNRRTKGWSAQVGVGEYDGEEMEDAGVVNNDVSSMKIWVDERCSGARSHQGMSGSGGGSRADADREKEARMQKAMMGGEPEPKEAPEGGAGSDGTGGSTAGSKEEREQLRREAEEEQRKENGGEPKKKEYPWWFWGIIVVLVAIVGGGVYFAVKRRNQGGR
mmetsp:Transcript_57607/g.123842  ORF Transcript_57607/g.123842 Transcript_57607/m.123842 type:complete len:565 (-) Transcript_57607:36-1730(-)